MAGDKSMPEMHLKKPGVTYSACGPFTKSKERIQKFMQASDTNYIYKNDINKTCFQHMSSGKYKDLTKRTQSDKVLKTKAFEIASNQKYEGLVSMAFMFFYKKSKGSDIKSMSNQQLAKELHMPIIKKFKKIKVYSSFKGNI